MTMLATVAAGVLAFVSIFATGPAEGTAAGGDYSPWYSATEDGTAEIHFYYAYSST